MGRTIIGDLTGCVIGVQLCRPYDTRATANSRTFGRNPARTPTQRDIRLFREILLSEEGVIAATVNSKGSGTSVFDRRLILWKELVSYEELDNANATERIISSVNLKGGIAFKMTDEQELVILEELRGYSALVKILKEKTLIGENHNEQI